MRLSHTLAAAAMMIGLSVAPASAALMTYTIDFSTALSHNYNPLNPPNSLSGTVQLTFDPTLTYPHPTLGPTLTAFDFGTSWPDLPLGFTYGGQLLTVGGIDKDSGGRDILSLNFTVNSFFVMISGIATTPHFDGLAYYDKSTNDWGYSGFNPGSVSVSAVSAVPLPATLPLFASGLGGFGLLAWRKRRKKAATPSGA